MTETWGHRERCLFWAEVFEHPRRGETDEARERNSLIAQELRLWAMASELGLPRHRWSVP